MTTHRQLLLEKAALDTEAKSHFEINFYDEYSNNLTKLIRAVDAATAEKAVAVTLEAVGDLADALERVKRDWLSPFDATRFAAVRQMDAALARYRELREDGDEK